MAPDETYMNFPDGQPTFTDLQTFIEHQGVLRVEDLCHITPNSELVAYVHNDLMTPPEILSQSEFEVPEVIMAAKYPNFDAILADRERVRRLQLLPSKSPEGYTAYHAVDSNLLRSSALQFTQQSSITMAPNGFPYSLPRDLNQYIIWLRDVHTERDTIATYIAQLLQGFNISPEQIIVYERSQKTKAFMVKRSFTDVRHLHFWIKKH